MTRPSGRARPATAHGPGAAAERDDLVAVALREAPADVVITGGRLVNVYSGEIHPADIATKGGRIAVVGDVEGCVGAETTQVAADGAFLVPGLVDCHIHVGASSLTMTQLARLLVARGTAAIVTDFTEAGKMQGPAAMRFFLDESARTPLQVYFSPFYTTLLGIEGRPGTTVEELEEMLGWPETLELREWNVYAQRHPVERMRALADLARAHGALVCGHMEGQAGRTLQASAAAGALSDHEAGSPEEAVERLRLGLALQIRYSSGADDLRPCLEAITRHRLDPSNVMFSTDEQDVDELAELGHIDHRVRVAIGVGVAPVEAIRMGSLNAARYLRVTADLGGLAPGRRAFVNVVEDLGRFEVARVVTDGGVVAEGGRYVAPLDPPPYPDRFRGTIRLPGGRVAPEHLAIEAPGPGLHEVLVIGIRPFSVRTEARRVPLRAVDGRLEGDLEADVAKIAVVERHTGSGRIGLGFVQGFGLRRGALGSSYHPGPVQIGVVGTNDADMARVVERIGELDGGFVVVRDGVVVAEVALPLLGFLSAEPAEEVVAAFAGAKRAIREELGSGFGGLFTALAYLCMPGVLPHARMSAAGPVLVEPGPSTLTVRPVDPVGGGP